MGILEDYIISMKSNAKDMVVIHLCVKLSVFAVSMATAGILKFPSLKTIYTHAIQHFY
jgi:hypothetical protein